MMATCKRGQNCAFYHNIAERRQPQAPVKFVFAKKAAQQPQPGPKPEDLKLLESPARQEKSPEKSDGSLCDPSTTQSASELDLDAAGVRRQRWTVSSAQERMLRPEQQLARSGLVETSGSFINPRATAFSFSAASGKIPTVSSMVNSFCSSKGLPYYTEMYFKDKEFDAGDVPQVEEEDVDDKFGVLEQIGTPNTNGLSYK